MEKKKKLRLLILLLILIILILLIIVGIISKNSKKNSGSENEIVVIRGLENKYPTNTFYLSQKYKGDMGMNEISTIVSKFMTSSIPTLKNNIKSDMNSEQLLKYYKENIDTIQNLFGKISAEEFVDIAKLVQTLKSKNLNYESSEYFIDSIQESGNIFKIVLRVKYENENGIDVIVRINNSYNMISFVVE